jgi:hypothetical protein
MLGKREYSVVGCVVRYVPPIKKQLEMDHVCLTH